MTRQRSRPEQRTLTLVVSVQGKGIIGSAGTPIEHTFETAGSDNVGREIKSEIPLKNSIKRLADTLESMNPQYPPAEAGLENIIIE